MSEPLSSKDYDRMRCAVWMGLSNGKVQYSNNRRHLIFVLTLRWEGRAQLSADLSIADQQLRHAGMDWGAITDEQIRQFTEWEINFREDLKRSFSCIIITGVFGHRVNGRPPMPSNNVIFIDGFRTVLETVRIPCNENVPDKSAIADTVCQLLNNYWPATISFGPSWTYGEIKFNKKS